MRVLARIVGLLVALAVLPVTAASRGRGPALPVFERGACPFECCTYGPWRAHDPVPLHESMDAGSPIIETLRRGEWVLADTGTVITRSPGHVLVLRDYVANDFKSNGEVHLEPGAELFLLRYQGEGVYLAWFESRLLSIIPDGYYEVPSPTGEPERPRLRIDSEPETEWWIHVERDDGTRGWTDAAKSFDGNDSCGGPVSDEVEP